VVLTTAWLRDSILTTPVRSDLRQADVLEQRSALPPQGADPSDFADALRGALTTYRGPPAAAGTIMQWAKDSHDLAASVAYQGWSDGDDLEQAYISRATKTVQDQLLFAGVRLARILDENFN
jgi:hypothetical protein